MTSRGKSRKGKGSGTNDTDATNLTSRAAFRLVAKSVGATNREADGLRQALLTRWAERGTIDDLGDRLAAIDNAPDRLTTWFAFDHDGDASGANAVLSELSDELGLRVRAELDAAS